MLALEIFCGGPWETNAYLVSCTLTKKGVVIDPAPETANRILEAAQKQGVDINAIWLTHSHLDHIADLAKLKRELNIPVYVHDDDAGNVRDPGSDGLPLVIPIESCEPDGMLSDRQELQVGELKAQVIHTPGHSPGGVCFFFSADGILFSGDTLFKGTMGNLSFPTSRPEAMWGSLKKLSKLSPSTIVYPGHGEKTTIGDEAWIEDGEKFYKKYH